MFDIIIRSVIVYVAIIVGLRVAGKRHMGQMSITDFVLVLLISNAVQNAMVGPDTSVAGGLAAAGTLIVVNVIVSWLTYKFRPMRKALEGSPLLLVYRGTMVTKHMEQEEITEEELLGVVRQHGLNTLADVYTAVLEIDGTISIVPLAEAKPKSSQTLRKPHAKGHRQGWQ